MDNIEKVRADIEKKLYLNQYHVDEYNAHVKVKDMAMCRKCAERPCTFLCPAAVYAWENSQLVVQYTGCLECGSCRFACPHDNLDWSYPRGGFGMFLQMG